MSLCQRRVANFSIFKTLIILHYFLQKMSTYACNGIISNIKSYNGLGGLKGQFPWGEERSVLVGDDPTKEWKAFAGLQVGETTDTVVRFQGLYLWSVYPLWNGSKSHSTCVCDIPKMYAFVGLCWVLKTSAEEDTREGLRIRKRKEYQRSILNMNTSSKPSKSNTQWSSEYHQR